MRKQPKTTIKQANWKSKFPFGKKKEYHNIITTVFYQGEDAFIDTDSKFLIQMVCEHFFHKHKKAILRLKLDHALGMMYPEAYRLYVYNLIYKELTKKKIKNDILKVTNKKELFYRAMLDSQMEPHQKRVVKIIKILNIDFKKESDRLHQVLFNMGKKKDFGSIRIKCRKSAIII